MEHRNSCLYFHSIFFKGWTNPGILPMKNLQHQLSPIMCDSLVRTLPPHLSVTHPGSSDWTLPRALCGAWHPLPHLGSDPSHHSWGPLLYPSTGRQRLPSKWRVLHAPESANTIHYNASYHSNFFCMDFHHCPLPPRCQNENRDSLRLITLRLEGRGRRRRR